jgi:DNA-binding NtrC family response regulator
MLTVMKVLVSWLGLTDMRSAADPTDSTGPILRALHHYDFDRLLLLSDHSQDATRYYTAWLTKMTDIKVDTHHCNLSSPTAHGEIFGEATRALDTMSRELGPTDQLYIHLSPGTPAMASIWVLLAKTRYPAKLIESSADKGVSEVTIPFEISAEFLPDLVRGHDRQLVTVLQGVPESRPHFDKIVHRSDVMKRLIAQASHVSIRDVPVLIQGESGTGKELLARAIHSASSRCDGPFVAVNCGTIPQSLFDSEFFGYEKGAFTGATGSRQGFLGAAKGGTLFLDEIGELPVDSQVKLLRALQEMKIYQLGAAKLVDLDFRVVAATNRNLVQEVAEGRFRADLFHRLALGVLNLPPLRSRRGDIGLLIDTLLSQLQQELADQPGFSRKRLCPQARQALLNHSWPGNVRELRNVLMRLLIWAPSDRITRNDVSEAIIPLPPPADTVLNRQLGHGFDLRALMDDVARHYLLRAMEESHGVKVQAAQLLGLPNYQTLSNWLKKYGVT